VSSSRQHIPDREYSDENFHLLPIGNRTGIGTMNGQKINEEARSSIRSFFRGHEQRIFKPKEISRLVMNKRAEWGIPQSRSIETVTQSRLTNLGVGKTNSPQAAESGSK
jgi:hypothetical protein